MRQLWPILTTITSIKKSFHNSLIVMLLIFYPIFKENKTN